MKFDFDDILIQPSIVTDITSRKLINPFEPFTGLLPLITAPMDTVIDDENRMTYLQNKIIPCHPRGNKGGEFGFTSYSLSDFNTKYLGDETVLIDSGILIDTANGHISSMLGSVIEFRNRYGNGPELMVGNVAHPETYKLLSEAGANYIRVGIGNGGGCLTTQQLGIGYPMGSLIRECYEISCRLDNPAKIVADGGMKKYSDIIKALALGADYVMLGSIFAKSIDSCGTFYEDDLGKIEITKEQAKILFDNNRPVFKSFRGMSTKEVQKSWGNSELKTSEGVSRVYKVEYTLEAWVNNFESYLRSAMSYTNSLTLDDFIGNVEYNLITNNAFKRFEK